jgi:hypothetical protein
VDGSISWKTGTVRELPLPAELLPNIRLIALPPPGPSLERSNGGFAELEVQPLTAEERRRLIVESLAQFAKALSPARVERIAAAPQTANPLFLRAMLEELRLFGVHERLDERLAHYLSAESIPDLYQRILERYEADYDRQRTGLSAAMCWLCRPAGCTGRAADLLGALRLPGALWSPLYLAADGSLVSRSGLIGFSTICGARSRRAICPRTTNSAPPTAIWRRISRGAIRASAGWRSCRGSSAGLTIGRRWRRRWAIRSS